MCLVSRARYSELRQCQAARRKKERKRKRQRKGARRWVVGNVIGLSVAWAAFSVLFGGQEAGRKPGERERDVVLDG